MSALGRQRNEQAKVDTPATSLREPISRIVTDEMAVTRPSSFGTMLALADDVAGDVSDSEETLPRGCGITRQTLTRML